MTHLAERTIEDAKRKKISRKLLRLHVRDIIPFEENARDHTDQQIDAICHSYKRHGVINPIIVDENNAILAGHGRYSAAQKLKLKKISVLCIAGLSEAEKRSYRLADNKLGISLHR